MGYLDNTGLSYFWQKIKAYIATKVVPATASPTDISSSAAAVGTSTKYAREDHTHMIEAFSGESNGTIKIAGRNVSVTGLKAAAYRYVATSINRSLLSSSYKDYIPTYEAVSNYVWSSSALMIVGFVWDGSGASTAKKTIVLNNVSNKQIDYQADEPIAAGTMLFLTSSYTNTANNPTFELLVPFTPGESSGNYTEAKPVKYGGNIITTTNKQYAGCANRPSLYIYDGEGWNWIAWSFDNYMELS